MLRNVGELEDIEAPCHFVLSVSLSLTSQTRLSMATDISSPSITGMAMNRYTQMLCLIEQWAVSLSLQDELWYP